jgi:hypothetical protein
MNDLEKKLEGQEGVASIERLWTILNSAYQPVEFRSNLKLWSAALLALALWIILAKIALGQFSSSQDFAGKIASQANSAQVKDGKLSPEIAEKIQIVKQANDMVASTAQNLYTFLTPIVTAVTGYFFVAAGAPAPRAPANTNPAQPDPSKKP